jgi:hypothetical protein
LSHKFKSQRGKSPKQAGRFLVVDLFSSGLADFL